MGRGWAPDGWLEAAKTPGSPLVEKREEAISENPSNFSGSLHGYVLAGTFYSIDSLSVASRLCSESPLGSVFRFGFFVRSFMAPASSLPTVSQSPQKEGRGSFFRLHALDWCYAREMMLPLSLGLIVLMLVMAGNFVYWAINSIVNQGLSIAPVLKLFILASPGFAVQGIPAGTILAVCLVLNRAVRDNEVLALRAGGASLPRIVAPFQIGRAHV